MQSWLKLTKQPPEFAASAEWEWAASVMGLHDRLLRKSAGGRRGRCSHQHCQPPPPLFRNENKRCRNVSVHDHLCWLWCVGICYRFVFYGLCEFAEFGKLICFICVVCYFILLLVECLGFVAVFLSHVCFDRTLSTWGYIWQRWVGKSPGRNIEGWKILINNMPID